MPFRWFCYAVALINITEEFDNKFPMLCVNKFLSMNKMFCYVCVYFYSTDSKFHFSTQVLNVKALFP